MTPDPNVRYVYRCDATKDGLVARECVGVYLEGESAVANYHAGLAALALLAGDRQDEATDVVFDNLDTSMGTPPFSEAEGVVAALAALLSADGTA